MWLRLLWCHINQKDKLAESPTFTANTQRCSRHSRTTIQTYIQKGEAWQTEQRLAPAGTCELGWAGTEAGGTMGGEFP